MLKEKYGEGREKGWIEKRFGQRGIVCRYVRETMNIFSVLIYARYSAKDIPRRLYYLT